jgi:predicted transposase YbfD/YdcC
LSRAAQIVLAHLKVAEKKCNEIPAAPELIEAFGVTDRLFTLDAAHCQKNL